MPRAVLPTPNPHYGRVAVLKSEHRERRACSEEESHAEVGVKPRGISPDNTIFLTISFEGPDQYSKAGGLGVRVAELSESLAENGYETHLLFVGDPGMPAEEDLCDGRLHLHRWASGSATTIPRASTTERTGSCSISTTPSLPGCCTTS